MTFQEIPWKSWNLWKFLISKVLGVPKPWYSLRIIGAFAMSWIWWNFTFSLKIDIIMGFQFFYILKNLNENALLLKKRAHGAQDPPKCIVFHWFKQHSRQPAARVQKHDFPEKVKNFFRALHEKMKISWKSWYFQEFHDFRHVKTSSIS